MKVSEFGIKPAIGWQAETINYRLNIVETQVVSDICFGNYTMKDTLIFLIICILLSLKNTIKSK